jgi:LysM repeat protein
VDPARRRELIRFGAPAAFLALVTVAVLLVKSALGGSAGPAKTTPAAKPTAARATTPPGRAGPAATALQRYYTIRSGDTLDAVAVRLHTTVAELLRLNPGIDPRALHTGQNVRVG